MTPLPTARSWPATISVSAATAAPIGVKRPMLGLGAAGALERQGVLVLHSVTHTSMTPEAFP